MKSISFLQILIFIYVIYPKSQIEAQSLGSSSRQSCFIDAKNPILVSKCTGFKVKDNKIDVVERFLDQDNIFKSVLPENDVSVRISLGQEYDMDDVKSISMYYRFNQEDFENLNYQLSRENHSNELYINSEIYIPKNKFGVMEFFGVVHFIDGEVRWINDNKPFQNYQFYILNPRVNNILLLAPAHRKIQFEDINSFRRGNSLKFVYDVERASILGVHSLPLNGVEARKISIVIEYLDADDQILMVMEKEFHPTKEQGKDPLVETDHFSLFENVRALNFKIYLNNSILLQANNDDNFSLGHKIFLPE